LSGDLEPGLAAGGATLKRVIGHRFSRSLLAFGLLLALGLAPAAEAKPGKLITVAAPSSGAV